MEEVAWTEAEKAHLILLGTTAGSPSIIMSAIQSGNIYDPQHMAKAMEMNAEWERGAKMISEAIERNAEYESGAEMECEQASKTE